MSAVSVEGVGLVASCPGTVPTDTDTSFQGNVSYTVANRGSEDALVNLLVELVDSSGNHTEESETSRPVAAGESSR